MLRSSLFDYSDAYILVKGIITVVNTATAGAASDTADKNAIYTNCARLTSCINRINNTKTDDA